MEKVIKIEGGHDLNGTVRISGSKNATVALRNIIYRSYSYGKYSYGI